MPDFTNSLGHHFRQLADPRIERGKVHGLHGKSAQFIQGNVGIFSRPVEPDPVPNSRGRLR
jgi:hypothetical protein